jgi:hypothetical protein
MPTEEHNTGAIELAGRLEGAEWMFPEPEPHTCGRCWLYAHHGSSGGTPPWSTCAIFPKPSHDGRDCKSFRQRPGIWNGIIYTADGGMWK